MNTYNERGDWENCFVPLFSSKSCFVLVGVVYLDSKVHELSA
jgi:hypothetical protein